MGRARLTTVLSLTATVATLHAQSLQQLQPPDLNRRGAAVERLHVWVESVRQHRAGTLDEPAVRVASWAPRDLDELRIELESLLRLMTAPLTTEFMVWADSSRGEVRRRVVYTGSEMDRLRQLAIALGGLKPGDRDSPDANERVTAARNRLLKRSAAMHTTLALAPPRKVTTPVNPSASTRDAVVRFSDGRQVGIDNPANHWRFTRALLERVAPAASADSAVRAWYHASCAAMLHDVQLYHEHFEQALRLFPDDAMLLTFSGSLHETLAAPRVQIFLRSASLPAGIRLSVGSTRAELVQAEALFRRALSTDPRAGEARLRLGRVLSLQERHRDALSELQRLDASAPSLLQYYGSLFTGSAAESLGRVDEARAAYARAATLYPEAHAPRFALSQLAASRGDSSAAVDALEPALSSTDPATDADPFWAYHMAAGRNAVSLMTEAFRALVPETTP